MVIVNATGKTQVLLVEAREDIYARVYDEERKRWVNRTTDSWFLLLRSTRGGHVRTHGYAQRQDLEAALTQNPSLVEHVIERAYAHGLVYRSTALQDKSCRDGTAWIIDERHGAGSPRIRKQYFIYSTPNEVRAEANRLRRELPANGARGDRYAPGK